MKEDKIEDLFNVIDYTGCERSTSGRLHGKNLCARPGLEVRLEISTSSGSICQLKPCAKVLRPLVLCLHEI